VSEEAVRKPEKMTEADLLNIIRAYEKASLGSDVASGGSVSSVITSASQTMTTLEVDRYNALNCYMARPLGNEIENRSQVVLPELADTVDWIMPQLMRMFAAAKAICRFEPEGPTDVDQAQIESEVVNHIFMKGNNGFFILYDYFWDAMVMRNGYASVDWVEETVPALERYSGLTEDELAEVMEKRSEDEEIEVLEQREYPMSEALQKHMQSLMPPQQPGQLPQQAPQLPAPAMNLFDIKLRRTTNAGRVKVQCIPPEEMRVSSRVTGNLEDSPFSAQITQVPRSDLVADGYDKAEIYSLTSGKPNWFEMDALARNSVVDQLSIENPGDRAMQEIEVRRVSIRVDFDGDGIAELRRVVVAGDAILENEEIEETPYTSCVPKRMPHRHTGISLYDTLADLQVIKTQLFRAGLDNLALANNTRTAVDWQNCNLDDLMTSRPGGVVRGKGPPGNWIAPLAQPSNIVEQVIPAMEYTDRLREMRTGVGRDTMGLDADALQDVTKGGQLAAMSAASLKIELIARLLAEGVKDIFTKIHNCILRHQDGELEFEIAGRWIKTDPTAWRRRTKVSPNVGLGSGNREEARANLQLLSNMQQNLANFGLVGPKQMYETFKRGCEVLGFENPQVFAMDPSSPEYAAHQKQMAQNPPPPPPQVQAAQIRNQGLQAQENAKTQRELLTAKVDLVKAQTAAVADHAKADREMAHETMQNAHDREIDIAEHNSQMAQTLIKVLGQIIASQLKQNAQADAGKVLEHDYAEVRGLQ